MKKNPGIISSSITALDPIKLDRINPDLKITLDFENCLGMDIVVLDRRGFEFKIPSRTMSGRKEMKFIIYEHFHFKDDIKLTFAETEGDVDIVEYRKRVLESLHFDSVAQRNSRKSVVSSTINFEDLKNNKGGVYIKENDLVVYIPEHYGYFIHPATVSKIVSGYLVDSCVRNEDFRFNIRINDPENKIGTRFINIAGTVYELPIVRDGSMAEGVLLSSSSKETDYKFAHVPMTLEEFDKNILTFKSWEEARDLGNSEEIHKNEILAERKRIEDEFAEKDRIRTDELNQSKHELNLEQSKAKQAELEHKSEIAKLNHVLELKEHEMELQSFKRKAYYEERSLDRKDSSEIIKWLPLILSAGLALFFRT